MAMIFIIGAAGVGKSTTTDYLKKHLQRNRFSIHDIDEGDWWTHDFEAWREAKIAYWLTRAKSNEDGNINTILSGLLYPAHVFESSSYDSNLPILFICLTANEEAQAERTWRREDARLDRKSKDSEVITKIEKKLKRQIEINAEIRQACEALENAQIIDTSNSTPEEVGDKVQKLIESQKPELKITVG